MLKFIKSNCKLILKSSQSAHGIDLILFDDLVIDYDTANDVFHPMSSYTTTSSLSDRLTSKGCHFGSDTMSRETSCETCSSFSRCELNFS